MPSEVSMSGAEHDREPIVEGLKRELSEAREQQAATAEILRVISSSLMELQGVFAAIAASAARLCDAYDAAIHRVDGNFLPVVAHHMPIPIPTKVSDICGPLRLRHRRCNGIGVHQHEHN